MDPAALQHFKQLLSLYGFSDMQYYLAYLMLLSNLFLCLTLDMQAVNLPAAGEVITHRKLARLNNSNTWISFSVYILKNPETYSAIFLILLDKAGAMFQPSYEGRRNWKPWLGLFADWCKNPRSGGSFTLVCHISCVAGSNLFKTEVLSRWAIAYSFFSRFFKFLSYYNT